MDTLLAFTSPLYEDVAINELAALLGARFEHRVGPGALLFQVAETPHSLIARIAAAPPVFTRQVLLATREAPIGGDTGADAAAILAVSSREALARGSVLVCDAEGRSGAALKLLQEAIAVRLSASPLGVGEGSDLSALHPLAVVAHPPKAYVGVAMLGAGLPQLGSLSAVSQQPGPATPTTASLAHTLLWPGGRPRLPFAPQMISRSALKLLEALALFALPAWRGMSALDLGAAPGGWTQMLAERGLFVSAVDPGELDPRAATLPNVRVHRMTAQRYLAGTPTPCMFLANDMRLDARESARVMVEAARLLDPDGAALMTLKLPASAPSTILRQALSMLRPAFSVSQARCLFYNRHEVTVYLRR